MLLRQARGNLSSLDCNGGCWRVLIDTQSDRSRGSKNGTPLASNVSEWWHAYSAQWCCFVAIWCKIQCISWISRVWSELRNSHVRSVHSIFQAVFCCSMQARCNGALSLLFTRCWSYQPYRSMDTRAWGVVPSPSRREAIHCPNKPLAKFLAKTLQGYSLSWSWREHRNQ
jgi:hypothetical protein